MSVNETMKPSILFFCPDESGEKNLCAALRERGIAVRRASSLSSLHIALASARIDAVVVSREELASRRITPMRHLWAFASRLTIIEYDDSERTRVSVIAHRIPKRATTPCDTGGEDERIERVRTAIESCLRPPLDPQPEEAPRTREDRETATNAGCLKAAAAKLHRKLFAVLAAIAESGSEGIGNEAIQTRIWGPNERNRAKDVQIYVSKIRKYLSSEPGIQASVSLEKKRYYLREKKA